MTTLKQIIVLLLLAPCCAIFSEGDDARVNLFGCAYAAIIYAAVKLSPAIHKALTKSFTSLYRNYSKI